jgi:hypothetical protein
MRNNYQIKKIIFLLLIATIGFQFISSAQKTEINSVHLFDLDAQLEQRYLDYMKKLNKVIKDIGYPKNYYSILKVKADDKSEGYRYCEIGHWTDEAAYKAVHANAKFLALWEEEKKSAIYINQQLYRRYYTLLSNH